VRSGSIKLSHQFLNHTCRRRCADSDPHFWQICIRQVIRANNTFMEQRNNLVFFLDCWACLSLLCDTHNVKIMIWVRYFIPWTLCPFKTLIPAQMIVFCPASDFIMQKDAAPSHTSVTNCNIWPWCYFIQNINRSSCGSSSLEVPLEHVIWSPRRETCIYKCLPFTLFCTGCKVKNDPIMYGSKNKENKILRQLPWVWRKCMSMGHCNGTLSNSWFDSEASKFYNCQFV